MSWGGRCVAELLSLSVFGNSTDPRMHHRGHRYEWDVPDPDYAGQWMLEVD